MAESFFEELPQIADVEASNFNVATEDYNPITHDFCDNDEISDFGPLNKKAGGGILDISAANNFDINHIEPDNAGQEEMPEEYHNMKEENVDYFDVDSCNNQDYGFTFGNEDPLCNTRENAEFCMNSATENGGQRFEHLNFPHLEKRGMNYPMRKDMFRDRELDYAHHYRQMGPGTPNHMYINPNAKMSPEEYKKALMARRQQMYQGSVYYQNLASMRNMRAAQMMRQSGAVEDGGNSQESSPRMREDVRAGYHARLHPQNFKREDIPMGKQEGKWLNGGEHFDQVSSPGGMNRAKLEEYYQMMKSRKSTAPSSNGSSPVVTAHPHDEQLKRRMSEIKTDRNGRPVDPRTLLHAMRIRAMRQQQAMNGQPGVPYRGDPRFSGQTAMNRQMTGTFYPGHPGANGRAPQGINVQENSQAVKNEVSSNPSSPTKKGRQGTGRAAGGKNSKKNAKQSKGQSPKKQQGLRKEAQNQSNETKDISGMPERRIGTLTISERKIKIQKYLAKRRRRLGNRRALISNKKSEAATKSSKRKQSPAKNRAVAGRKEADQVSERTSNSHFSELPDCEKLSEESSESNLTLPSRETQQKRGRRFSEIFGLNPSFAQQDPGQMGTLSANCTPKLRPTKGNLSCDPNFSAGHVAEVERYQNVNGPTANLSTKSRNNPFELQVEPIFEIHDMSKDTPMESMAERSSIEDEEQDSDCDLDNMNQDNLAHNIINGCDLAENEMCSESRQSTSSGEHNFDLPHDHFQHVNVVMHTSDEFSL
eukprot:CAMPEP_0115039398 /NCGR_PEP_ID=MMETSP0216-20121206/44005_1 /TAXON_ID=223996 /ORGANISM="Protocruzia adherens, Strain Boccale" /LENGTH=761 /DNA_ID=CAMNT_0002420031 /DNA_START=77 /DNA_END=2362 /DNA_ORIENTATION=-